MCLVQINRVNGNERFEEDDFDEREILKSSFGLMRKKPVTS